jgi:hypothetical protein
MDLAIGIADIDIIVINQADTANTGARSGFCGPGADTTNADDTEMGLI